MTRKDNDGLYSYTGPKAAERALRPGGVLAIWSAAPDSAFSQRLRQTGFHVEEVVERARGGRGGARHIIWLATKAANSFRRTPEGSRNQDWSEITSPPASSSSSTAASPVAESLILFTSTEANNPVASKSLLY